MTFNDRQEEVVNHRKGVICIDAGPGTGKTHTITQRYLRMLSEGIDPDDVLLLTFTDNAASEMRGRVVGSLLEEGSPMDEGRLHISTFHSFCARLLRDGGGDAARCLGIDRVLSERYSIMADEGVEESFMHRCLIDFARDVGGRHGRMLSLIGGAHVELGHLIAKLLSKGIVPTANGWLMDGGSLLLGDREAMISMAQKLNQPATGARGMKNSPLRGRTFDSRKEFYDLPPDAFGDKSLPWSMIESAVDDDREDLVSFVHDVYLHVLRTALGSSALTFGMLIMLAFLKLSNDDRFRNRHQFKYVMVDEFQDTNELQFMLCLLLLSEPNLCVVGDWRQGIFGFRDATVENLSDFEPRLLGLVRRLDDQGVNGLPMIEKFTQVKLIDSYRSSTLLKELAEKALRAPMGDDDQNGMEERLRSMEPLVTGDPGLDASTSFRPLRYDDSDEEMEGVLDQVAEMVGDGWDVVTPDGPRPMRFDDIGILCRKRSAALRLQGLARERGLPLVFDGGSDLLSTPEAKILLAWLRVLVDPLDARGWAPIMLRDGMPPSRIRECLREETPEHLMRQRNRLTEKWNGMAMLAAEVYRYERIHNSNSMAMTDLVDHLYRGGSMGLPGLVRLLERNLHARTKYDVISDHGTDVVRVQTIHGAKGLQYPAVILADCNKGSFPPRGSDRSVLIFDDTIGLRCTKVLGEVDGLSYRFDSWRTRLVRKLTTRDLDEERRLLYVAMTRARQYLVMTCHDPSPFVDHLCSVGPEKAVAIGRTLKRTLEPRDRSPSLVLPASSAAVVLSPHDLMPPIQGDPEGRGKDFGIDIHRAAERLALDMDVENDVPELDLLRGFLETNRGMTRMPELDLSMDLDGILLTGRADLVLMGEERALVVDYKTDRTMLNHEAYRIQMSVYHHALSSLTGLDVGSVILYLSQGEERWMEPMSIEELTKLAHRIAERIRPQGRGS